MEQNVDVKLADAIARRAGVRCWAAIGLVAAAGTLVWWASGIGRYRGTDYMIGPYQVPVMFEYAVGAVAIAAGCAALVGGRRFRTSRHELSRPTVAVLAANAGVAAWLWRVMTLGVDGANIGGAGAALVGPFLVAALLFAALHMERAARGGTLRRFRLLAVLAWAVAPALLAMFWFGLR
jgi:hypothetical protein